MKKKYKLTYNTLVNAYRKVILSITIEKDERVKFQLQGQRDVWENCEEYKDVGGELEVEGLKSWVYMYGGTAPINIRILLKHEHLHKIRKKWLDFLYPHYQRFIPELTKTKMWELINEGRNRWDKESSTMQNKVYERKSYKTWKKSRIPQDRSGNMPTGLRLWPLATITYNQFLTEKVKPRRRAEFFKRKYDVDKELYEDSTYNKLYVLQENWFMFSICDGKIIMY